MSSQISARTAELGLTALRVAVRNAAPRRNGSPIPVDIQRALAELESAANSATGTELAQQAGSVPASSQRISVAEAAKRLGITDRGVRRRIAAGTLTAERIGSRTWTVEWADDLIGKD